MHAICYEYYKSVINKAMKNTGMTHDLKSWKLIHVRFPPNENTIINTIGSVVIE